MKQQQHPSRPSESSSQEISSSSQLATDPAYLMQATYGNQFMAELAAAEDSGGEPEKISALPGTTADDQSNLAVAQYREIEARSKRETDGHNATFQHMNADYDRGFTYDPADNKSIKNNQGEDQLVPSQTPIHMGYEGEAQRTNEETQLAACNGVDTLAEYRRMLSTDFNFNGVINKYAGTATLTEKTPTQRRADGMADFLKDVVERFYPGMTVTDPAVQTCVAIARQIWSYACCGYDMQGNTDISQMQGLLYVFDKEIRGSSNTNTKMADPKKEESWFIVPGTEDWPTPIKVLKGDGRHGRATILTTRHLLAGMTTTPETTLTGFDETYMLIDRSGSMLGDEYNHLSDMLGAGGIDGELQLAGYNNAAASMMKVQNGEVLTPREARAILMTISTQAQQRNAERANNTPQTPFSNVDPALTTPPAQGTPTHEEGLTTALAWARDLPDESNVTRQLIVVTDEMDYDPRVLAELQQVASAKNLSVKVLYSFNSSNPNLSGSSNADSYVIVDVMFINNIVDAWKSQTRSDGGYQLDWYKVAMSQGAEIRRW